MQSCISVENLCKYYQIEVGRCRHDTLRDQVSDFVRSLLKPNGHSHAKTDIFWALKDVSFQINVGEVVGVIGKMVPGKARCSKYFPVLLSLLPALSEFGAEWDRFWRSAQAFTLS